MIIIGLAAGIFGSIVGVGGGIIITPALTFLGFPPAQIASTSLIAVTFASSSSTMAYARQKRIQYQIGIKIAASAIPGAIVGAYLSSYLALDAFKIIFAIILLITGLYIIQPSSIKEDRVKKISRASMLFTYTIGFVAGTVSSLFGIGGGIVFVPVLVVIFGMPMFKASPTSQLAVFITSVAGSITHSVLAHPDYTLAVFLSAGATIGGQIGAKISYRVKESLLRKVLFISLFLVAARLIFDSFINLQASGY
jgi:uncharacterized membrane protein YfcA